MTAEQLIAAAAVCVTCGKEHHPYKVAANQVTWASENGHPYRPRLYEMTGLSAGPVLDALRRLAASRER